MVGPYRLRPLDSPRTEVYRVSKERPTLIIRQEDLLHLQEHPATAPDSELDRLDLYEDLAHSVSREQVPKALQAAP
jgi:hypothetical protein